MPYFIGIPIAIEKLPFNPIEPYREIPKDKLHITLVYIGSLKSSEVSAIKETLDRITSRHKRFKVVLRGVVALPSSSKPRYLALAVIQRGERLSKLRMEIITELINAGIVPKDSYLTDFKPHVTFAEARVKPRDIPHRTLERVLKQGKRIEEEVEVEEVVLYDSSKGIYKIVSRHKLLSS